MQVSSYNSYFLYIKTNSNNFVITDMQIDNILTFATLFFSEKEEIKLQKVGLVAKSKTFLLYKQFIEFNDCKIQFENDNYRIVQKG